MDYDIKERWIELCEKAAAEQNPGKLLAFVTEINRLLEAKQQSTQPVTDPGTLSKSRGSRGEAATSRKTQGT